MEIIYLHTYFMPIYISKYRSGIIHLMKQDNLILNANLDGTPNHHYLDICSEIFAMHEIVCAFHNSTKYASI